MSSGRRTAFIYSPQLNEFDYGPGHPLRPLPSTRAVEPEPATDDELQVFLKPNYRRAKARAWEEVRGTVARLKRLVFPRHGI